MLSHGRAKYGLVQGFLAQLLLLSCLVIILSLGFILFMYLESGDTTTTTLASTTTVISSTSTIYLPPFVWSREGYTTSSTTTTTLFKFSDGVCPMRGCAGGSYLIADSGNNRILEVDASGGMWWEYGSGFAGNLPGQLNQPRFVMRLPGDHTLITDSGNHRIIEVSSKLQVLWQYGASDSEDDMLRDPSMAVRLANGNTLITDSGNNRVVEVDKDTQVVWSFGEGQLNQPSSAFRLCDGNTLIADSGNQRVIEAASDGSIIWELKKEVGSIKFIKPVFAVKLESNNYLITDSGSNMVVELTPSGMLAWSYDEGLSAPSSAIRKADGATVIADSGNARIIEVSGKGDVVSRFLNLTSAGRGRGLTEPGYASCTPKISCEAFVDQYCVTLHGEKSGRDPLYRCRYTSFRCIMPLIRPPPINHSSGGDVG